MARYIDADALIEKMVLGEYIFADTPFQKGVNANTEFWISEIKQTPTADVVPRAEYKKVVINMNAYGLTAKRLAEENESLEIELENMRRNLGDAREGWNDAECEVERLRKALDAYEETSGLKKAKAEVAREIFEEIEKQLAMYSHIHKYAEEAKKVTEEYADGSPVEMTSVWDACRLEHNGYDDYETMCQLQDNIGNIEKSRLLKEFEVDIAQLKKKYVEGEE